MSDDDTKSEIEAPTKLKNSKNVTIAFKLNGRNYPIWSRLMKVKIGGRGAYSRIRKEPPEPGSKGYDEWEEDDLVVFSWIVDNIAGSQKLHQEVGRSEGVGRWLCWR